VLQSDRNSDHIETNDDNELIESSGSLNCTKNIIIDGDHSHNNSTYPPEGLALSAMVEDLWQNCRHPVDPEPLPPASLQEIVPQAMHCRACGANLSDPLLVTEKGKIFYINSCQEGKINCL
jgi:hypothetical protein